MATDEINYKCRKMRHETITHVIFSPEFVEQVECSVWKNEIGNLISDISKDVLERAGGCLTQVYKSSWWRIVLHI